MVAPRVIGCAIDVLSRYWEGRMVIDVNMHTTQLYGERRARSASTVRRELSVLRAAINYAVHRGIITRAVYVELPKAPPPRDRWLTRQEAAKLIRAACTRKARLYLPLFILIGLYTGRRTEAILSLRWPHVDLVNGIINFELPERGQTDKRRGRVRIPPKLMPHLKRARLRGADLGYVIHDSGKRIKDVRSSRPGGSAVASRVFTHAEAHGNELAHAEWRFHLGRIPIPSHVSEDPRKGLRAP